MAAGIPNTLGFHSFLDFRIIDKTVGVFKVTLPKRILGKKTKGGHGQ